MWTAEKDAQLARLWPNYSASQIALKLGVSRNAIIGRYHRVCGHVFPSEMERRRVRAEERAQLDEQREQQRRELIRQMMGKIARGHPRDQAITEAVQAGATIRAVGSAIGVTFQRIQQIVIAESARAA